ncbi:MAG: hypothetical protein OSB36_02745 [Longimicrobiales bacterium]|jgi:putative oxidoreductase|nr:hypothetical protein [Longimicrobiales bacterium]HCK34082.1 DoxX family protein [Gemmatimonadota bacterium]
MSLPMLGKYLYTVPFVWFGIQHFTNAAALAGMVPIPGGALWVYLTGLCLLAASVSVYTGKHTALAMKLLGLLLLIIVVTIHVPAIMGGGAASWITPMVHTTGLAGGAFVLAGVHEGS